MKKPILFSTLLSLLLFVSSASFAADFYWRSVAVDNVFTNIGNWETSPDNGISPSVAPGVNDNVFFNTASNMTVINLNNGNCRDFNVLAEVNVTYTFNGVLTAINGNLNCKNGNAKFNLTGTQNFTGSGDHFINMGTNAVSITGTSALLDFNNGMAIGTYSLNSTLNIEAGIRLQSQHFYSTGFSLSAERFSIQGNSIKTIDLSNSTVTITSGELTSNTIQFLSAQNTTTYTFLNTHFILNNNHTLGSVSNIQLNPGVQVSFKTLTLNSSAESNNVVGIVTANTGTAPSQLTVDSVNLNTANLAIGINGFDNSYAFGNHSTTLLNFNTIQFLRPCTITSDAMVTFSIAAIAEPVGCSGQSAFVSAGYSPLTINFINPIVTTTLAFSGINFIGSNITVPSICNLGNNSGSVTWGTSSPGTRYWWVGGEGNWDDPTKWSTLGSGGAPQLSSACLPTLADDVFFDANSFTGVQTVMINTGNGFCRNISWIGNNNGSLTTVFQNNTSYSGNLFINGNADLSGAGSIAANLFYTGSGNHTIRSGSHLNYKSPAIKIMGTGTYTLEDNLRCNISSLQLTTGKFVSGGNIIDVSKFCSRSMPEVPGNIRSLNIINSEIHVRSFTLAAGRRTIDLSMLGELHAAGSHFKLHHPMAYFTVTCGNTSSPYLSTVAMNNISFLATSGTQDLISATSTRQNPYTISYNVLSFSANANITLDSSTVTHNANDYNFSSGFTYTFSSGDKIYNILSGINTILNGCQDLIRIQSSVPGNQANLNKVNGAFNVYGALLTDINSVGSVMNVTNGADLSNNSNLFVTNGRGRKLYWVENTGNWSDGPGHWSIGVSGGSPSITNPLGCIPRQLDDVVFDENSFSTFAPEINMDIDGNARSLVWATSAGSYSPIFRGSAIRNINVYDSIQLATGMASPYLGKITMLGSETAVNENSIKMNGVKTNGSIIFNGNGRYDMLDSIHIASVGNGLELVKGSFFTNGNSVYASGLSLNVTGNNEADISNSFIHLFNTGSSIKTGGNIAYKATHSYSGKWNASGSNFRVELGGISISNSVPVTYSDIHMHSVNQAADIVGNPVQPITFKKITWHQTPLPLNGGSFMDGVFIIDTLIYPSSSFNTLAPGGARSYTINDTLIVYGTPCLPAFIRSSKAGVAAVINSTVCNLDLNLVNIKDIKAGLGCAVEHNKIIGTDEGGNSNWTITGIAGLSRLGNDTAIICNSTSIAINTTGFGSIPGITYMWNTGNITETIEIDSAGTYGVTATYAPGCFLKDSIVVSCATLIPVTLTKFNAIKKQESSLLSWQTSSENNTARFEIEHSTNGRDFRKLSNMPATNTSYNQSYSYVHSGPLSGMQFYRLKIIDMDGTYIYSSTEKLHFHTEGQPISVYPNPATDHINVSGAATGSTIKVISTDGRIVASHQSMNNTEKIEIGQLSKGVYLVVVVKNGVMMGSTKFLKN